MAKVTPTVLLRGLPCASFNVPANLIRRGTANVGTSSLGACAVRLGACTSAATDGCPGNPSAGTGRCCACTPHTQRRHTTSIQAPIHVRFMGLLLPHLSRREENS